jgi:biopolymer transport protein ExbD/biopolymer transport protein TolR
MTRPPRKLALVRPVSRPQSAINVTPLVDVVLVLLIIFMVVMPLAEKDLAVRIPANEQVQTLDEVPTDQLVVRVEGSGRFRINGEITADDAYVEALAKKLQPRAEPDRVVFVSPEDEAPYPRLVRAFEGARRAGATALGMVAEPTAPLPQ